MESEMEFDIEGCCCEISNYAQKRVYVWFCVVSAFMACAEQGLCVVLRSRWLKAGTEPHIDPNLRTP